MYGVRERVLLRHLLAEGQSLSATARQLGVHRATLHRWLQAGLGETEVDTITARYTPRPPVPRKLDPFIPLITERLREYPVLSAQRLFEACRAAGYGGGYSQVRDYVRTIRPVAPPAPIVRFETPLGHQAQVDFAHVRLPWGVRYALVVVLAASRHLVVRFGARQDLATLLASLTAAVEQWGGVPRELLFDQMRTVLTRDDRLSGGGLLHNLEFLRWCRHYGVTPRVCRPYRAQTKGKVERPIRYLRESFLYGRTFLGDADLAAQCDHWLATVANQRVHGTTKRIPQQVFEQEERPTLQPLPARPYVSRVLAPVTPVVTVQRADVGVRVERRPLAAYAALGGEA
jgi:transposase